MLHHDIATKNVLLDENLVPKISDFGLASQTDTDYSTYFQIKEKQFLPIRNFSPERFDLICSEKSEVYSYGFAMYEIFTRGSPSHPLEGRVSTSNYHAVKNYVQEPTHIPSVPTILTQKNREEPCLKMTKLFRRMWAFDRHDRPTFSTLASEIRTVHNFIGKMFKNDDNVNFLILSNPDFFYDEECGYTFHVNQAYQEYEQTIRQRCSNNSRTASNCC